MAARFKLRSFGQKKRAEQALSWQISFRPAQTNPVRRR